MQFFVMIADLTDTGLTNVPIQASYADIPVIDRNFYGSEQTVLTLDGTMRLLDANGKNPYLDPTWRTNPTEINLCINGEAERRIVESFTEFMQRNALQETQRWIISDGNNTSMWPPSAQSMWAAALQGWTYIDHIRTTSDSLISGTLPLDPTNDSHWPTRIPVVFIPVV
jgi:hypothetical protein